MSHGFGLVCLYPRPSCHIRCNNILLTVYSNIVYDYCLVRACVVQCASGHCGFEESHDFFSFPPELSDQHRLCVAGQIKH